MRIVIAGATGFIGRALSEALCGDYEVIALSRDARRARQMLPAAARPVQWDARTTEGWAEHIDGAAAVVDLVGENIGAGRWTRSRKRRIMQSRADAAEAILTAVRQARTKPEVVILGSAVGYYGPGGDETLDEGCPAGDGFLPQVCRAVEGCADALEAMGVRAICLRTGLVLGPGGGALQKMALPFRFHVGGRIGGGRQWMSWVSLRDEVAAIRYLIENKTLRGAYNVTAPQPARAADFFRALGRAMGRRSWTVMPAFVAVVLFGQMADEVLLTGQRVAARRLAEAGFTFQDRDLQTTLDHIY